MSVVTAEFPGSTVKRASYDSDTQCLIVEFGTGRSYRYKAVPSTVYDWLVRAKSKGAYINGLIKDRYEYEEITPDPPQVDLTLSLAASLNALHGDPTKDDE
ncbi:MAG TPA: KTSC domain-containing protein [Polyangiaceae bacterium]|nr:KTSC domain-containing protein [Polyangiaceae bacterium]